MQHYELLYAIPNRFTEDEAEAVSGKINDLVKKSGGSITVTDNLGEKRLAYPIKKTQSGVFLTVEFDAEPAGVKDLDAKLKLTSEVLRHQIAKKKVKTAEEIAREKLRQEKLAQKMAEQKEKVEPAPKVSIEELDKKLGEILDGDII